MSAVKSLGTPITVKLLTAGWSKIDRFYPSDALVKIAYQFTPGVGDFSYVGDPSPGLRPKLENISHRTNRIFLRNDNTEMWGEVQLLDTRAGNITLDMFAAGKIKFDAMIQGKVNYCDELIVETIQYLRVTAYGPIIQRRF